MRFGEADTCPLLRVDQPLNESIEGATKVVAVVDPAAMPTMSILAFLAILSVSSVDAFLVGWLVVLAEFQAAR